MAKKKVEIPKRLSAEMPSTLTSPIFQDLLVAMPEPEIEAKAQPDKMLDLVDNAMARAERYRSQVSQEMRERETARRDEGLRTDPGALLGTILGGLLMGKETGAMSGVPMLNQISADQQYRKTMGMKDREESLTALKGYYDMLLKGIDHYDKIQGLKDSHSDAGEFQDEEGYWFRTSVDKQSGASRSEPVIVNGKHIKGAKPFGSQFWQMQRWVQDWETMAIKETQKLTEKVNENDKDMRELEKDGAWAETLKARNPKLAGMSNKEIIAELKRSNIDLENQIEQWQNQAIEKGLDWKKTPKFYNEKSKEFRFGSDTTKTSTKKPGY